MCPKKLLLCLALLVLVSSDNENRRTESRKARLFTFNTLEEDVAINLEFSIPFITIPTKKAADTVYDVWSSGLPTININPASLALGGAVLLGTTVLIPLLLKSYTFHHPQERYSRLLDTAEFSTEAFLDMASQVLTDSQGIHGCALRIACWTAQRATKIDTMRFWNQVMSNTLISSMINATAVQEALLTGRKGRDCTTYMPCPLREQHVPALMSNIALLANTVGS